MTDIPNSNFKDARLSFTFHLGDLKSSLKLKEQQLGLHWDKQARGVPVPAGPTASAISAKVRTVVAAAAAAVVLATAPATTPIPANR
ncbi:hypothetical protein PG995_012292 [Apiospora arundinis]